MIELEKVLDLMDRAADLVDDLDGITLEDNLIKEPAASKTAKAKISRDMLRLADTFALCEALVRAEYWSYKQEAL